MSIFTFRFCSDTSANFYRNRNEIDLRLRFSVLLGRTLRPKRSAADCYEADALHLNAYSRSGYRLVVAPRSFFFLF